VTTTDLKTFGEFVRELATERRWRERDGVILAYVEERTIELALGVLRPDASHGSVWMSRALPHYTGYYRANFDRYIRLFEQFEPKFPADFTIDRLRADEASMVAEHWPYDLPDKTETIRWWISSFPSICTRDNGGRPVAWTISYSFGPTGAAYVLPEYRGKGIQEIQMAQLLPEIFRINPGIRFFWILDDNIASLKQTMRTAVDVRPTDLKMRFASFTNPTSDHKVKARL
jgi:GNAT superfamily N-acetyltransferase